LSLISPTTTLPRPLPVLPLPPPPPPPGRLPHGIHKEGSITYNGDDPQSGKFHMPSIVSYVEQLDNNGEEEEEAG